MEKGASRVTRGKGILSTKVTRECIRFSSLFTLPFFLFTDRSIIRRIVSMDRRSPEILLDPFPIVSRSRLLFLFFVSREGEGGEEIEEEKQWRATCKLIPCVRT